MEMLTSSQLGNHTTSNKKNWEIKPKQKKPNEPNESEKPLASLYVGIMMVGVVYIVHLVWCMVNYVLGLIDWARFNVPSNTWSYQGRVFMSQMTQPTM